MLAYHILFLNPVHENKRFVDYYFKLKGKKHIFKHKFLESTRHKKLSVAKAVLAVLIPLELKENKTSRLNDRAVAKIHPLLELYHQRT